MHLRISSIIMIRANGMLNNCDISRRIYIDVKLLNLKKDLRILVE